MSYQAVRHQIRFNKRCCLEAIAEQNLELAAFRAKVIIMSEQRITARDAKRQALEIINGTISQLNSLVEALAEDMGEDAHIAELRHMGRPTRRRSAKADRRVKDHATAYLRKKSD